MSLTTPELRTLIEILNEVKVISSRMEAVDKYRRYPMNDVMAEMALTEAALLKIMRVLEIRPEVHGQKKFLTADDLSRINHHIRNPAIMTDIKMAEKPNPRYTRLRKPPK